MNGSWWMGEKNGYATGMEGTDALPDAHQTQKLTALFPVNFFAKHA
ncbi:hypothetical protein [Burkholderia sp. S171]|nr:hypothetical protein [Burkholderia sp. S171]